MKIKAESASAYVLHCENLCKLAGIEPNFWEGHKLYQKLRRLELQAHKAAERYANGEIDEAKFDKISDIISDDINHSLLPRINDFFVNADPRGYALKIDSIGKGSIFVQQYNFYKDMGGYGILAPDFS